LRGASVVTVASAGCEISPVDAMLQEAGATTIELFHGTAGAYWHGFAESNSAVRAVWSNVDRELQQGARHATVVGGMPIRVARTRPPHVPPRNVLVMTNLVHRDHGFLGFPWRPFQKGLLQAIDELSRDASLALTFRWRPHPADAATLVRDDALSAPKVELSIGHSLQADLDWADVAVSNPSTVLVEALLTGIPVIAYLIPDLIIGCEFVHPSRVAFNGPELRKALGECVTRLTIGDPDALAPERHARTKLFGPEGVPRPLDLREAHAARPNAHAAHPSRSNGVAAAVTQRT
jgi:hypothetical protein